MTKQQKRSSYKTRQTKKKQNRTRTRMRYRTRQEPIIKDKNNDQTTEIVKLLQETHNHHLLLSSPKPKPHYPTALTLTAVEGNMNCHTILRNLLKSTTNFMQRHHRLCSNNTRCFKCYRGKNIAGIQVGVLLFLSLQPLQLLHLLQP